MARKKQRLARPRGPGEMLEDLVRSDWLIASDITTEKALEKMREYHDFEQIYDDRAPCHTCYPILICYCHDTGSECKVFLDWCAHGARKR